MPHSRLLRNVSAEAGARVLYLATRFFIPPFVLARIGMEAYGLYGTVFILVAYFGVSAIGFSNAYVKYVAQYAASGETDRANRLLSSGLTIMSGLSLFGFGMLILAWPWVAAWMKVPAAMASEARFLTFLITGVFFAYLAFSVYRDVLTGLQEIALIQKVWIVSFVVETALIFGLVGAGFGLRGLGLAFFARTAVDLISQWWLSTHRVPWLRIRFVKPDRESLRLLAGFGGIVQVNCLVAIFLGSVERVIATPLLGLEASGLLDLAKRFPGMATSIPSSFASSVLPSAAEIDHKSPTGRRQLRELYLSTNRYMNTVSGILFAFLCFAAFPALKFWLGKVPAGATELMVLFAVASQVHLMTGPGTSVLKASGRPAMEFHYSVANLIALALLVPATRVLIGRWDVTGIAVAVACSTVVSATWFLIRAHRELGIRLTEFTGQVLFPGFLPYIAAALCISPFATWAGSGDQVRAASALVCTGSIYMFAAAALVFVFAATQPEQSAVRFALAKLRASLLSTGSPVVSA